MSHSHADLCKLAVAWLRRPQSRGGHACHVAIAESRTGWAGETPDALGYRFTGAADDGTVMVECKVSRADFLADKRKPHRAAGGVGDWRYFMVPEGLVSVEDLPERWGLITVNQRGHMKTVRGVYECTNIRKQDERRTLMLHETDRMRELFLVVRLFGRIQDPDSLVAAVKERTRLGFKVTELQNRIYALNAENEALKGSIALANEDRDDKAYAREAD